MSFFNYYTPLYILSAFSLYLLYPVCIIANQAPATGPPDLLPDKVEVAYIPPYH